MLGQYRVNTPGTMFPIVDHEFRMKRATPAERDGQGAIVENPNLISMVIAVLTDVPQGLVGNTCSRNPMAFTVPTSSGLR